MWASEFNLDRHLELLTSASHNRLGPLRPALASRASARRTAKTPARIRWSGRCTEIAGIDRYPACLVLLLLSCRHSPDDSTQGTTAQIVHAVEMTRQASNHDKRAWLDQLRNLPCKSDDVCQLKDLCTKAYDSHLMGVDAIGQARAIVSDSTGSGSTADASEDALLNALSGVQAAQRQLRLAKQQTQTCAENEAIIRQRYRL